MYSTTDNDIHRALAPFGVNLRPAQIEQVRRYIDLLAQWNRKVSLTSIADPAEILTCHFGESMFAVQFLDSPQCRIADVGSGAGFPGLAMKLLATSLNLHMIEANRKKVSFLSHVITMLELDHATVEHGRYETVPAPPASGFDVVCCRALGKISTFLEWAGHRLVAGGQVILWLGEADSGSVVRLAGWSWKDPIRLPLSRRRFLVLGRLSTTY